VNNQKKSYLYKVSRGSRQFMTSSGLFKYIMVLAVISVLSACATSLETNKETKTSSQPKETLSKQSSSKQVLKDSVLEKQDLNKELLQSLLIERFSVYSSDWATSVEEASKSAKQSKDWRLAKRAAEISFSLAKDYSKAYEMSELWLQLRPNDHSAKLYSVVSGVASGQTQSVLGVAFDYLDTGPKGFDEALKVLSEYLRSQSSVDAVLLLTLIEPRYKNNANFNYESTLVNAWFKRDKAARSYLAKALAIDPSHQKANLFKYQLIAIEDGVEAANNYLKLQIVKFPESKNLRNQHLANLYEKQQFSSVVEMTVDLNLSEAKLVKLDGDALYLRGASLVQLGRLIEAEAALEKVLQISPDSQSTRLQLGRLYFLSKRYEKSIETLNLISAGDEYFDASLILARALAKFHDGELGVNRALRKLNGLAADTKTQVVERALAQSSLLSDANQKVAALGYLGDALSAYPNNLELLYARGLLASGSKELAVAEADLGKLIKLQPNNSTALNALGYTLVEQTQRYDEAQVLIDKALKLDPESHYILDSAGWLAFKQGKYELAYGYIMQSYKIERNPEVAVHLGYVLSAMGRSIEARGILMEVLKENPGNEMLIKALNQLKLG